MRTRTRWKRTENIKSPQTGVTFTPDRGDLIIHLAFNPLGAKFFRGNKYTYLYFISFFHTDDMAQVVEIFPQIKQGYTYPTCIVNIMAADVLARKRARASAFSNHDIELVKPK